MVWETTEILICDGCDGFYRNGHSFGEGRIATLDEAKSEGWKELDTGLVLCPFCLADEENK